MSFQQDFENKTKNYWCTGWIVRIGYIPPGNSEIDSLYEKYNSIITSHQAPYSFVDTVISHLRSFLCCGPDGIRVPCKNIIPIIIYGFGREEQDFLFIKGQISVEGVEWEQ